VGATAKRTQNTYERTRHDLSEARGENRPALLFVSAGKRKADTDRTLRPWEDLRTAAGTSLFFLCERHALYSRHLLWQAVYLDAIGTVPASAPVTEPNITV
jgi:hypothetical protein